MGHHALTFLGSEGEPMLGDVSLLRQVGIALKKSTDDPKPMPSAQIGPAPQVPLGFWGTVIFHYKDSAPVALEVRQTFPIEKKPT